MSLPRRNLLATVALSSASIALNASSRAQGSRSMPANMNMDHDKPERPAVPRLPVILCRTADTIGVDEAYHRFQQGADSLDVALTITAAQEDNPNDFSTGISGLPNADGVIQLDACCFHGPTRRSAAVGGVGGIRNPSLLARAVMEKTGYPLLVGAGAERFGMAQGLARLPPTDDRTQKTWALWKQVQALPRPLGPGGYDPDWPERDRTSHFLSASQKDFDTLVDQFAPLASKAGLGGQWTWHAAYEVLFPAAMPLYVAALGKDREMSCAASTSGLPWRMQGAVSDVAILGAGCYLDPEVGSAGASGSAEANTRIGGARLIVENMRSGMSPERAGMDALHRIADWYRNDPKALRFVDMIYYVLRRDGAYACVSLWQGDRTGHPQTYTVHDGLRRSEECTFLFHGSPLMAA